MSVRFAVVYPVLDIEQHGVLGLFGYDVVPVFFLYIGCYEEYAVFAVKHIEAAVVYTCYLVLRQYLLQFGVKYARTDISGDVTVLIKCYG